MKDMKLFYSTASPFVKKVLVVIYELKIQSEIVLIPAKVNPIDKNQDVSKWNPSGEIPTLVIGDAEVFIGSTLISQYLAQYCNNFDIFPAKTYELSKALQLAEYGDVVMKAGVLRRYEHTLRPQEFFWREWSDGQLDKIDRILDVLENKWISYMKSSNLNIGLITVACSLSYLNFRFPDYDWGSKYSSLKNWHEVFEKKDSMIQTTLRSFDN